MSVLKSYSTNNNNNKSKSSLDPVNGCKKYQIVSRLGFKQMTTEAEAHNTSP